MKKVIAFLLCMVLTLSSFSIESNAATEWIDINEVRIENVGEIVAGRTTNFVLASADFPEYIRIGQILCRDYEADALISNDAQFEEGKMYTIIFKFDFVSEGNKAYRQYPKHGNDYASAYVNDRAEGTLTPTMDGYWAISMSRTAKAREVGSTSTRVAATTEEGTRGSSATETPTSREASSSAGRVADSTIYLNKLKEVELFVKAPKLGETLGHIGNEGVEYSVSPTTWSPSNGPVVEGVAYKASFKVDIDDFDGVFDENVVVKLNGNVVNDVTGGGTDELTCSYTFPIIQPTYSVNATVYPKGAGKVKLSSKTVKESDELTVEAVANEGYEFDYMTCNGLEFKNAKSTMVFAGNDDLDFNVYFKEVPKKVEVPTDAYSKVSDWAKVEVDKAVEANLEPDTLRAKDLTFNINRQEFAAVAVKLYESLTGKSAKAASENPFSDTDDSEILKAYSLGITTGTSATTFEPGAQIDREQMATMLTRALTAAKINTTVKNASKFDDDKLIQDWARDAVYFMNSKGIIKGVGARAGYGNNCFGPLEKSTREQALLIAVRCTEAFK